MMGPGLRPEALVSYRLLRALAGVASSPGPAKTWSWRRARVGRAVERLVGALRPVTATPLRLLDRCTAPVASRPLPWLAAAIIGMAAGRLLTPGFEAGIVSATAFGLAGMAVALGFGAALHRERGDRVIVLRILVLGALLRLALGALIAWRGGFPDEWGTYFPIARDSAECWSLGGPSLLAEHPFVDNRATYFYTLSAAFLAAGPGLVVGRILGAVIGLLAALAAGECARAVAGHRAALVAVALIALHPEHAFWSVTLSRDSLTVLLVLVTLATIVRRPGTLTKGTLLIVSAPLLLLWWNGFLFAALLTFAVLLFTLAEALHRAGRSWRGAVVLTATLALGVSGLTAVGARLGPWLRPDLISLVRTAGTATQADFLPALRFETWFDVAAYAPAGSFFVLFAPLPWDVVHTHRLAYALLALVGLAIALVGVVGLVRMARERPHLAAPFAVYAGLCLLALALLEGTGGIVVRHRLSLTAVLAIGAAALLARAQGGPAPEAATTP